MDLMPNDFTVAPRWSVSRNPGDIALELFGSGRSERHAIVSGNSAALKALADWNWIFAKIKAYASHVRSVSLRPGIIENLFVPLL
jgi:hypothetical protein